jgi:hypothetical protein
MSRITKPNDSVAYRLGAQLHSGTKLHNHTAKSGWKPKICLSEALFSMDREAVP